MTSRAQLVLATCLVVASLAPVALALPPLPPSKAPSYVTLEDWKGSCYRNAWQPGYTECWGIMTFSQPLAEGKCYGHWYVDSGGGRHGWCYSGEYAANEGACYTNTGNGHLECYGATGNFDTPLVSGNCIGHWYVSPSGGRHYWCEA